MLSFAQPTYLKDAEITVKLKDGSTYTFNSNDYAVVSRKQKQMRTIVASDGEVIRITPKMNMVSIYLGRGPDGLTYNGGTVSVDKDAIFGAGISQRLDDKLHLELIGLSNETFLAGFKYGF